MTKATLTETDKKRIEEEEKYRTEVRKGLEETPKQKSKGCGTGCLVVFLIFVALGAIGVLFSSPDEKEESKPPIQRNFKASVRFTGTQFVITNLDDLDCQNAKMEINGGIFKGGYVYEGYILEAGETYEVGAMQFTKSDGARFNPFETKPKEFFIMCGGRNLLNGASRSSVFK